MQPILNCFLIRRSKHVNKQKRKNDNILVCYRWEKIFSRQPNFLATYNNNYLGDFRKVKYSKSLLNKFQLFKRRIILSCPHEKFISIDLASVVQKVDNTINWINHYPVDNIISFLSGGWRYPKFEQLGPVG